MRALLVLLVQIVVFLKRAAQTTVLIMAFVTTQHVHATLDLPVPIVLNLDARTTAVDMVHVVRAVVSVILASLARIAPLRFALMTALDTAFAPMVIVSVRRVTVGTTVQSVHVQMDALGMGSV